LNVTEETSPNSGPALPTSLLGWGLLRLLRNRLVLVLINCLVVPGLMVVGFWAAWNHQAVLATQVVLAAGIVTWLPGRAAQYAYRERVNGGKRTTDPKRLRRHKISGWLMRGCYDMAMVTAWERMGTAMTLFLVTMLAWLMTTNYYAMDAPAPMPKPA
jgi:hypothetical protein